MTFLFLCTLATHELRFNQVKSTDPVEQRPLFDVVVGRPHLLQQGDLIGDEGVDVAGVLDLVQLQQHVDARQPHPLGVPGKVVRRVPGVERDVVAEVVEFRRRLGHVVRQRQQRHKLFKVDLVVVGQSRLHQVGGPGVLVGYLVQRRLGRYGVLLEVSPLGLEPVDGEVEIFHDGPGGIRVVEVAGGGGDALASEPVSRDELERLVEDDRLRVVGDDGVGVVNGVVRPYAAEA